MRLVYYTIIGVLGYIFGFQLATCSKESFAQAAKYEMVHLNSNNTVVLRGEIEDDMVTQLQLKLTKLAAIRNFKNYPIYLVLDSPGGSVVAGKQLIEFAKIIPDVRTITIFAASMAAVTVESLPGARLITSNGELMFHRAFASVQGQVEVGELESRLDVIKDEILDLETTVAARLMLPVFIYKAEIHNEMWLDAKKSLAKKAADKIVDISCSEELVDARIKTVVNSLFGSATLVYSGCPTLRSPVEIPDESK